MDYLPSGGSPQHAQILTSGRNCNSRCGCQHDGGGTGPRSWVEQGTDHVAERRDVHDEGWWNVHARSIDHEDDRRRDDQDDDEDDWFFRAWWLEEINHHSFNVDGHVQWFGLRDNDEHRHDHNNDRDDV